MIEDAKNMPFWLSILVDSYTPRSHEEIVKAHLQRISLKEESAQVDGISLDEQVISNIPKFISSSMFFKLW